MKRIGVVIPVYNTVEYLRQCIESILNQTYKCLSVVLVDDGSTDGSGQICDEYAEKNERVSVIHQKNSGIIQARYIGTKNLDCDYVTFVDSDDWLELDTYERFVDCMSKEIDVISWYIVRYANENVQAVIKHGVKSGFYDSEKFQREVIPFMIWDCKNNTFGIDPSLCNKLIKKELIMKSLEEAREINVMYGEDAAVMYPLLLRSKTMFLTDDALYYHRQRPFTNKTPYFSDEMFQNKIYVLYDYLKSKLVGNPELIKQLNFYYVESVIRYGQDNFGMRIHCNNFVFPFDKVPKDKNIILYGASSVGQSYYRQLILLNYAKKILWVDKNAHLYEYLGVKGLDALAESNEYDFVVIAIKNPTVAENVRKKLLHILKVNHPLIVWSIKEVLVTGKRLWL